ncbi:MAG: type I restriction enzyme HsdR N-terminal domain-containing protein [Bacteroidetes bacterium]|nr:type I restriction enzyme HsdR N-terminal domain-containing protein [Bacteroidota bacterium]
MNEFTLEHLNFPDFSFRVREQGQSKQIFDSVRRRFVALTPEEWVRQNLIQFMVEVYQYPLSLMAVEKIVKVNGLSQRADVVVYDRLGSPWLIAECKAPSVSISQDTFLQAARYNFSLNVSFLLLTNGHEHFCLKRGINQFEFMESLPKFEL